MGTANYDGTYNTLVGDLRNSPYPFPNTADLTHAGLNEGDTLTADAGLWSTPTGSLTFTHAWYRDNVAALSTGDLAVYGIVLDGTILAGHVLHKNDVTETATGSVTIDTVDADTQIGRRQSNRHRAPALRAFLIIDRALTPAEIADLKSYFYMQYGIKS